MFALGAPELIILLVFGVVPMVVIVWGIIDAAVRPDWAWERAGQNKILWVVLQLVGVALCWLGFILSIVYFAAIRPKVRQQQGLAGS